MFSQECVILFTGGGLPSHNAISQDPPATGQEADPPPQPQTVNRWAVRILLERIHTKDNSMCYELHVWMDPYCLKQMSFLQNKPL